MKRTLFSLGAALVLAAALPVMADAAPRGGGGGGHGGFGGGGGFARGGGGFGGGGFARGGGGFGGGAGFARAAPSGGAFAMRSGGFNRGIVAQGRSFNRGFVGRPAVGRSFAAVNAGRNWQGNWRGRRHFRGAAFALGLGFGAGWPYDDYGYDDSYYDYAAVPYGDDSCYQWRVFRGAWRQVWVCD